MPTLRNLLGDHGRALRGLRDLSWLLDVDIDDVDFKWRTQWILIQMVTLVILHNHLQSMGYLAQGGGVSVSLADCLDICQREDLLSTRQLHWLRYFNSQANRAKHELSRL